MLNKRRTVEEGIAKGLSALTMSSRPARLTIFALRDPMFIFESDRLELFRIWHEYDESANDYPLFQRFQRRIQVVSAISDGPLWNFENMTWSIRRYWSRRNRFGYISRYDDLRIARWIWKFQIKDIISGGRRDLSVRHFTRCRSCCRIYVADPRWNDLSNTSTDPRRVSSFDIPHHLIRIANAKISSTVSPPHWRSRRLKPLFGWSHARIWWRRFERILCVLLMINIYLIISELWID